MVPIVKILLSANMVYLSVAGVLPWAQSMTALAGAQARRDRSHSSTTSAWKRQLCGPDALDYLAAVARGGRSSRTIFPPFITNLTRCSSVMSASGSPDTAMRSAYLPFSIDPTRSCHPIAVALTIVADWMALAGDMPARWTNHASSSAWVPCGNVEPSTPLPAMTLSPLVAAAMATAFSKIGIIRYLPPVLLLSLSSMYGSV